MSKRAAQLAAEQQAAAAAALANAQTKSLDDPSLVHEQILEVYKKSQKLEKESKGLNNNSLTSPRSTNALKSFSFSSSTAAATATVGGGGSKLVSFGDDPKRSEARLGFRPEQLDGNTEQMMESSSIQPYQYPKLFSHSGFSPAAEEVHHHTLEELASSSSGSMRKKKGKKSKSNDSSSSSRSSSASSTRSNSSSSGSSSSSRSVLQTRSQKLAVAEARKEQARKNELNDPIFHNSVPTSDAGFLETLSAACMNLRSSSSEENTPPTMTARLDEVDAHALFSVGANTNLKNLDGLAEVIRALVQPYRVHSWKLSHLEGMLCRVRVIYRWITSFIKLEAPPLPPPLTARQAPASITQIATSTAESIHHSKSAGDNNNNATSSSPPGSSQQQHKSGSSSGTKAKHERRVVVSTPQVAAAAGGSYTSATEQQQIRQAEQLIQSVPVPKFFPYKYEDCDDPDDALFMKNEFENAGTLHHMIPNAAAGGGFIIGEETSINVFNSRVGDCHQIAALFSFMCRHPLARILPEYDESTDFSGLGVKVPDASASELCSVSTRKTVAGPTGRAAAKCDAASSPNAMRRSETVARAEKGGGAASCRITTVRGTLKGCMGEMGKSVGYIPWSWNMIRLPDGKRYLLDVSSSMAQVTDRFLLSMGAQNALAEAKRNASMNSLAKEVLNQAGLTPAASSATAASGGSHHGSSSSSSSGKKVKIRSSSQGASSSSSSSSHHASSSSSSSSHHGSAGGAGSAAGDSKIEIDSTPQPVITPSNNVGPAVFLSSNESKKLEYSLRDKPLPPPAFSASSSSSQQQQQQSSSKQSSSNSSSQQQQQQQVGGEGETPFPTFSNFNEAPLALNAPISLDAHTASMHVQWVTSRDESSSSQQNQQQQHQQKGDEKKSKSDSKSSSSQQQQQNQQQQNYIGDPPAPVLTAKQQLLSASPSSLLIRSFIPFFFMTNPLEFAVSHYPRQAQHLLLTSPQMSSQPSEGVFKPPFSQGAWESYPRLSHRFLELGLRLKTRCRRSIFSIPGPPEYLCLEAKKNPEKIETKLFVFKCSAYSLNAQTTLAPTLNPLQLVFNPSQVSSSSSSSSSQQQQQQQQQQQSSSSSSSSSSKAHHHNAHHQKESSLSADAIAVAQQLKQQQVDKFSSVNSNSQNEDQFVKWVREQQYNIAKYWSASGSGGARLATQPFHCLPRTFTATTCQRSSGVFAHTLTVPDVGIYTAVIGVREVNPSTGRPVEPYFWPAVSYQVSCNFSPSPEPPIAVQREATIAKMVRPLCSILPASVTSSGIPFVVAPLLPRIRGVAVVNAVEKQKIPKSAAEKLKEAQAIKEQKDKAEREAKEAATAASSGPSRSQSKSAKLTKQQQAEIEKEKAAAALAAAEKERQDQEAIDRVDVHLLKWDASQAAFSSELLLEPGNCSVWAIVENVQGDMTSALPSDFTSAACSSSSFASALSSSAQQQQQQQQQQMQQQQGNNPNSSSSSSGQHQKAHKKSHAEQLREQEEAAAEAERLKKESDPLKMALTGNDGSVFSKLNPLCLPHDFDARGMEQMLNSVVPAPTSADLEAAKTAAYSTSGKGGSRASRTSSQTKTPAARKLPATTRRSSPAGRGGGKKNSAVTPIQAEPVGPPPNFKLETFVNALSTAAAIHEIQTSSSPSSSSSSGANNNNNLVSSPSGGGGGGGGQTPVPALGTATPDVHAANVTTPLHPERPKMLLRPLSPVQQQQQQVQVFAVPLWTGIQVQRKVQSKDVALVTNNAGFAAVLGVTELSLGLHLSSSFRVSSGDLLARKQSQASASTQNVKKREEDLLTSGNKPAGLIFPVKIDLHERNAINLALCGSANQRTQSSHKTVVGDFLNTKTKMIMTSSGSSKRK